MIGRTYKSEGIVLKSINYKEADKIFTIYSKHFGKISLLAKGIRRLTSRKRGNLEVFSKISFIAAKGKNLDIITEVKLLDGRITLRNSLIKIGAAYQICEALDKLTADEVEQKEVYDLLDFYLERVETSEEKTTLQVVKNFCLELVKILGFLPKDKPISSNFDIFSFIEEITEKELKSKRFFFKSIS